ncbi:MAG: segregation/condensation protein A, partial [Nanoarchaeota archaeon]
QLYPWDIDLAFLTGKYLEKIRQVEEADFFVSSKILLAASLLLRIKTEILLYRQIRDLDEILFGKKEESKSVERIEIDESELPLLYPKTPLPRFRRVTLQELMSALDKAISTETRRIKKEVVRMQQEKNVEIVLPKRRTSIGDKIRKIYSQILTAFKRKQARISYSELTGGKREEKLACFLPCLHLDSQHKIFLEQEGHFQEIWLWLYHHYKKQAVDIAENMVEEKKQELEEETGFDNPLANFSDVASEIMKGELD